MQMYINEKLIYQGLLILNGSQTWYIEEDQMREVM